MTKPPFQIDPALLAKVAAEDTATDKASDKAWLLVGLLEHMLEHHGVQELVRRGCPPPLIGALSEYVPIGECDAGWPAFQAVIEQLTELYLSNPDWDAKLRPRP